MNIDRIKLSEEVSVFGRHYWVGLEAELLPGEDELFCLNELKKRIENFNSIDYSQRGTIVRAIDETELPIIYENQR